MTPRVDVRSTRSKPAHDADIHLYTRAAYRAPGQTALVRRAALAALAQGRHLPTPVALTIRLTDDAELRALNRQYRVTDAPTDVLSFGGEGYRDGQPSDTAHAPAYLGDIAISMERCAAQAKRYGHPIEDELALLVIHGVLHLLGYDHHTPARRRRMWQAQDRAFALLGRPNPLKPDQFHD
ncbi:MAG: endoribonuclease YbeY [Candidatus Roseilinea sp.]|nr:MAG: endoribonuclease YbeY [Candidatus Roseilinea sp.]